MSCHVTGGKSSQKIISSGRRIVPRLQGNYKVCAMGYVEMCPHLMMYHILEQAVLRPTKGQLCSKTRYWLHYTLPAGKKKQHALCMSTCLQNRLWELWWTMLRTYATCRIVHPMPSINHAISSYNILLSVLWHICTCIRRPWLHMPWMAVHHNYTNLVLDIMDKT